MGCNFKLIDLYNFFFFSGNNICQATGESNLVSLGEIKNSQFHVSLIDNNFLERLELSWCIIHCSFAKTPTEFP